MCGISGCFLAGGQVDTEALQRSIDVMNHRGPDERGVFVDGTLGFGHARLSIIDLSTGQQPMTSADGRYVIVFNGEIYNFPDLRKTCETAGYSFRTHSDTEVILALYAAHGTACVERLRGMFAFAIYDRRDRSLFLARDRLGVKPLLYARTSAGLFFASEMPALLTLAPTLRDEIDSDALGEYFVRQYISAPRTAFRQVRKLEAGTWLLHREGGLAEAPQRYWFPERVGRYRGSKQQAIEELRERFTEATKIRLISERPVGALLSGGTDSSITVAVMAKLLDRPVKTYSVGFNEKKWDERPYARAVARHCGTDHEEFTAEFDTDLAERLPALLHPFGEPYADDSLIPSYYAARLAHRGAIVILTGDGADEIWAGYKRAYHAALLLFLNRYHLRSLWLAGRRLDSRLSNARGRRRPFPRSQLDRVLLSGDLSPIHLTARFTTNELRQWLRWEPLYARSPAEIVRSHWPTSPEWDELTDFLYYDVKTFLANDVLPKVDIATMLNSVEARSPFLDHRVVEFVLSLPREYKLRGFHGNKYLLKETFADLLPAGLFQRPKMGFTPPMETWLRTLLKEWCADQLSSDVARRVFNHADLMRRYQEHQAGANHARVLWMSAVFCQWANQYQIAV
jgi:asparagine synthase (glutamine-hydrolysing)